MSERVTMQLRDEAFNIFNHDQFADPDLDILAGSFGQIASNVNYNSNNDFAPPNTGSGTPRQLKAKKISAWCGLR